MHFMANTTVLRVLYLEDDPEWVEQLKILLFADAISSYQLTHLMHAEKRAFDKNQFDVVLWALNDNESLENIPLDMPLIFLISADTPVDHLIEKGAQDCLVKEQLTSTTLQKTIHCSQARHQWLRTQLERQTAILRASEKRLQAMIDKSPDSMLLIDRAGIIRFANPASEVLFHRPLEELIGEMVGFPIVVDEAVEIEILRKGGKIAYAEMRLVDWEDGEGLYLASLHNITKRKQAEATLLAGRVLLEKQVEERTAELRRALRLKNEFLANISHELRTPLNIILNSLMILREKIYGDLTSKQDNTLQVLEKNAHQLLTLIDNTLMFAQLEANRISLHPEPIPLADFCQAQLDLIQNLAAEKQIHIDFTLEADTLIADVTHFKQILLHLLTNAVKFTPPKGTVGLTLRRDANKNWLELVVWDTGIGIVKENQKHIFDAFVQLDGGLNRQQGGTGLGLSLVKRLVELHHGYIRVESEINQGSRFIVSLPWQPPTP